MDNISNYTTISNNENNQEQIEVVYENGFIRNLLGKDEKKEVYIKVDGDWADKANGKPTTFTQQWIIDSILLRSEVENKLLERFNL